MIGIVSIIDGRLISIVTIIDRRKIGIVSIIDFEISRIKVDITITACDVDSVTISLFSVDINGRGNSSDCSKGSEESHSRK